jgi:hypothetical protein
MRIPWPELQPWRTPPRLREPGPVADAGRVPVALRAARETRKFHRGSGVRTGNGGQGCATDMAAFVRLDL